MEGVGVSAGKVPLRVRPCVHRGRVVRTHGACVNSTVYACPLHGECTFFRVVRESAHVCYSCDDYVSSPPKAKL